MLKIKNIMLNKNKTQIVYRPMLQKKKYNANSDHYYTTNYNKKKTNF